MQIRTTNNVELSRFEVYADGQLAGYSSYRIRNGRMSMLHTGTDPRFQRMGLASAVVRAALESARFRDLKVLPYCGFVARYIRNNDQYLDLVPEDQRRRSTCSPRTAQALSAAATSSLEWSGGAELMILVLLAVNAPFSANANVPPRSKTSITGKSDIARV